MLIRPNVYFNTDREYDENKTTIVFLYRVAQNERYHLF